MMKQHKRIWLQVEDGDGNELEYDKTWCEDNINESDVEYVLAAKVRNLEAVAERGSEVRVVDGDVWLSFGGEALISVEAIIGGRGPVVKQNVRKWRDNIVADLEDKNE